MSDPEEIRALIHAYAERLDAGDLDGVARLFEHATWRSGGRSEVFRGFDEIRPRYDGVILYEGRPRTRHVISNTSVATDGSDVGTARSSFTVFQATPALPLQSILVGSYHDTFERFEGVWRFADRLITVELMGDLSAHMAGRS